MARKCIQCGHDNEDGVLRCVCGTELPANGEDTSSATVAETEAPIPSSRVARGFGLRNLFVLLWLLAFFPLLLKLHGRLPEAPARRGLIGGGVFLGSALAAFLLLGRDKHRGLRITRMVLVAWAVILFPQLFLIVDGIVQEGWPSGRFNRPIAKLLTLNLAVMAPTFLTSLVALMKLPRVAGGLALLSGLNAIVTGFFLLRVAAPITHLRRPLTSVLDAIVVGTKLLSYLTIPMGVALVVVGILSFRAARERKAT